MHVLSGSGSGSGSGSSSHGERGDVDVKTDVDLVIWLKEFTEKVADERFELRQITTIMAAMSAACKSVVLGEC